MSKPAFTPGPWSVRETDTLFIIESVDGIRIASTSWHSHLRHPYPLKPEARANAHKLGAAPAMYEALERAGGIILAAAARMAKLCQVEAAEALEAEYSDILKVLKVASQAEGGEA